MVKLLFKVDPDSIPESCTGYLEAGNKSEVIYRTKDAEAERKMDILVSQAIDLYYASDKKEVTESEEYKMLERFFREQTEVLEGKLRVKDKIDYSEFKVDESKNVIIECTEGEKPYASYNSKGSYKAYFERERCERCPLRNKCRVKITNKKAVVRVSEKAYSTSILRAKIGTEEYSKIANQRVGVEGIPSVLRRKYKVDTMPVRGLLRSKFWFGLKIAAMNFKSLMKWIKKDPKNRLTPSFLYTCLYFCLIVCEFFDSRFKKSYFKPVLFVG